MAGRNVQRNDEVAGICGGRRERQLGLMRNFIIERPWGSGVNSCGPALCFAPPRPSSAKPESRFGVHRNGPGRHGLAVCSAFYLPVTPVTALEAAEAEIISSRTRRQTRRSPWLPIDSST